MAMTFSERRLYAGPEVRDLALVDAECRMDGASDGFTFTGYASIFNVPYSIRDNQGEYQEMVSPTAFDRSLAQKPDTIFQIDHQGPPLARTKSGTLQIRADGKGLLTVARLDRANPRAVELKSMVDRGDLDEMSFSFRDESPSWNASYTERVLRDVSIHRGDISAVSFAANSSTAGTLAMRSLAAFEFETRAKYSSDDLTKLGKAGKAFLNPDGHYSFPLDDREDLENAVRAVGRAGASHNAVRKFIIARAKVMGLSSLIPASWKPDGSLRSADRLGEYRAGPTFLGCNCCGPCTGAGCDGTCCDSCPADQLKAAGAFLSVYNSDTSSESMDQPGAEALSLMRETLEIRRRVLRLKIGEQEFRAAERRVRAAREPLPGESRAAFAIRQRADAIVARLRAEQRGVHR